VRKLSFTGSTEVGRILYAHCATNVKKISLELGGNAPFIVFDSADVDLAVRGLMASKFRNAGQTCVCSNRIFVHRSVHDEFVGKVVAAVEKELRVGDGLHPETNQGPLINESQFDRVKELVESAERDGAKVVCGGTPLPSVGPLFFSPTVITGANPSMKCFSSEQFGPIVAVCKFETEDEVVRMANDSERGLAGYFYSRDVSQIWRVALSLEVGMVGANEAVLSMVENAFGGIKQSGIGSEGSKYGIDEYLNLKSFTFGGLNLE
jgi:acyl-CoA reductase-like NAD-dependent aldehyde dehydrogenase